MNDREVVVNVSAGQPPTCDTCPLAFWMPSDSGQPEKGLCRDRLQSFSWLEAATRLAGVAPQNPSPRNASFYSPIQHGQPACSRHPVLAATMEVATAQVRKQIEDRAAIAEQGRKAHEDFLATNGRDAKSCPVCRGVVHPNQPCTECGRFSYPADEATAAHIVGDC